MCHSDKYPTCYDLKPITLDQGPSITDLEVSALNAVDLAEKVSEPINRFSLARGAVRLIALIARARRDRFSHDR